MRPGYSGLSYPVESPSLRRSNLAWAFAKAGIVSRPENQGLSHRPLPSSFNLLLFHQQLRV